MKGCCGDGMWLGKVKAVCGCDVGRLRECCRECCRECGRECGVGFCRCVGLFIFVDGVVEGLWWSCNMDF